MGIEQPAVAATRFVLVGTSHPGNVGAAARAMKTMGQREMVLVAPECDVRAVDAYAMASGAEDLIQSARRAETLQAGIADCVYALGCTARRRSVPLPEFSPREAVAELLRQARHGPVALVFGRERTGLSNEELQICQGSVLIPSDPSFASLNIAAAVQVLAYELRVAQLGLATTATIAAESTPDVEDPPATVEETEGLFGHLDRALHAIDFHKGRSPDMVMQRLRRLLLRAGLDAREVRILRGILADAERMARLARGEEAEP